MQDVRVYRGADAATDHYLVQARLTLKLKKRDVKRSNRTIYNVDFLKDISNRDIPTHTKQHNNALQDLLDEENMDIDTQGQHGDVEEHTRGSPEKEKEAAEGMHHC